MIREVPTLDDGRAALAALTVGQALRRAAARLADAGLPEPRADAEVLLAHVLSIDRQLLVLRVQEPLAPELAARFEALLARRLQREPTAQLVGVREFWSLPFRVDRRVLIPRPETELVVETALAVAPGATRVLDVGTGSGVLAVALARELPRARVVALDRSPGALAIARENVQQLAPRVRLVCGDLLAAIASCTFDLVVANPPYVPTAEIARLAPELRDYEPRLALDGGADGLAVIRALLAEVPRVLLAGGWLVFELGAGQAGTVVQEAARETVWGPARVVRDLAGIERVMALQRQGGR